jgi:hypothetical protein
MKAQARPFVLAGALLVQACAPPIASTPLAAANGATAPAQTSSATQQQILAALQERRYADAIRATRRAEASRVEIDFAVGELVLQGLADPQAAQRPLESAGAALALIETSALAGHRQAASALAATFTTGLRDGLSGEVLVAVDARLSACWETAKSTPAQSAACVAMRAGR